MFPPQGSEEDGTYSSVEITGDGTTDTILSSDRVVYVDSSAATHTINLPANPETGEVHTIRRDGANTVTVDGNGNNIQEGTTSGTDFDLADDAQRVTLHFDGTLWRGVD